LRREYYTLSNYFVCFPIYTIYNVLHMKNIIDYKYMIIGTNQSRLDRYLNRSASGASSRSFARIMRQHYSLITMLFRDPRQITFVSRSSPTCRLRHDRFRTINNSVSVGRTRSILSRFRDLFASLTENDEWIRFTRSKTSPLLNDISTRTDKKEPILRMQSSIVVSRKQMREYTT